MNVVDSSHLLYPCLFSDCQCNGKSIVRNEKLLDGECNSIRRFEDKDGQWRSFCYVDPGEECEDAKEGWSFDACKEGMISIQNKQIRKIIK